eukprot:scaffold620_cov103-Cylindrotheca_fusiformis.AAC.7
MSCTPFVAKQPTSCSAPFLKEGRFEEMGSPGKTEELPNARNDALHPQWSLPWPFPSFETPFADPRMEPRPLANNLEPLPLELTSPATCHAVPATGDASLSLPQMMTDLVDFALDTFSPGRPEGDDLFNGDDVLIRRPRSVMSICEPASLSNKSICDDLTCIGDLLSKRKKLQKKKRKHGCAGYQDERLSRFNDHHEGLWQEQFEKLLLFKQEFGTCNIPITSKKDQVLARWVKRQRYQFKRHQDGKSSAMNKRRIQLLEAIGFVWDAHGAAWQEKFAGLVSYKLENGHCNVPANDPCNAQLATWVKCQRRQYRLFQAGKISHLNEGRMRALDALGFVWNFR